MREYVGRTKTREHQVSVSQLRVMKIPWSRQRQLVAYHDFSLLYVFPVCAQKSPLEASANIKSRAWALPIATEGAFDSGRTDVAPA